MIKSNLKVWILDDEWLTHDVEKSLYEEQNIEVKVTTSESFIEDLECFGKYADGVVAQVGFELEDTIISKLEKCKIIASSGVGVNHIDVQSATNKGIHVTNQPDYCLGEVSDHTISLALVVIRRLRAYNDQIRGGKWNPLDTLPVYRLQGKTVGLLGFGRIAKEVAKRFKAFGVHLIAFDKYADESVFKDNGVESVSFDELMQRSDILSLHIALTKETEGMINYDSMSKLPKGAIIINTCRGAVINEADLIRIIKEGHLAGAGLDVLVEEPPNPNLELLHMDEVYITPHSSYVSIESEYELRSRTTLNVIQTIQGGDPEFVLNKIK